MIDFLHNEFCSVLLAFIYHASLVASQTYTCGGTAANNSQCHFPFEHSTVNFSQCTYYGKIRPWCYVTNTTTGKQTDKWGYCDCPGVTPSPVASVSLNDSIPPWYAYTKANINNGVLKAVVIPLAFKEDNLTNGIEITDSFRDAANGTTLYYLDSSWNAMTYSWTYAQDTYLSDFDPSEISIGQISLESYKFASENDNLRWCIGPCGRNDGYHHNLGLSDDNYDQIVLLVTDQSSYARCFMSCPFSFLWFFLLLVSLEIFSLFLLVQGY